MSEDQQETLLEFPCDYAVKAMGETTDDFPILVLDIVKIHVDGLTEESITVRQSSGGKYTSVTVSFQAFSKAQLDAIYQGLSDHPRIKYAL